MTCLCINRVW